MKHATKPVTKLPAAKTKARLTEKQARAKASQIKLRISNVISKQMLKADLDVPSLALRAGISQKRIGELMNPIDYKVDFAGLLMVCSVLKITVRINGKKLSIWTLPM